MEALILTSQEGLRMNDAAARRDSDDRAAAAQRLLAQARVHDDTTHPQGDTYSTGLEGAALTSALSALSPAMFAPTVLVAADELLAGGEAMTVAARQRLVDGAERAVRWRKNMSGSLWRALRAQREVAGLTLADLAGALDMPEASVRVLERGDLPVQELEPHALATWIRTVDLDKGYALPALRRSLLPFRRDGVYAGTADSEVLTGDAGRYFDAVSELLK